MLTVTSSLPPPRTSGFAHEVEVDVPAPISNNKQPEYENTVNVAGNNILLALPASPISTNSPSEKLLDRSSDAYTDVTGTLPGFLRTNDMCMVQAVTEEVATAAAKDKTAEVAIPTILDSPKRWRSESFPPKGGTYANPQDAKAETSLIHAELRRKASQGRGKEPRPTPPVRSPNDRDDYTIVSDALPAGIFERVEGRRSIQEIVHSNRLSKSEGSPVHSRKSLETSRSVETSRSAESEYRKAKTQSLRHQSPRKEGFNSPPRRKSHTAKEMVNFSPQTGFKLAKNRALAESVAEQQQPAEVEQQELAEVEQQEPAEKPLAVVAAVNGEETDRNGQALDVENKRLFEIPVGDSDVCKHSYALVDSTVKDLPEGHHSRVEGIGTPKHYSVPLTAVVTN